MPKAVDLFCGSGGFSAGMIDAGIEVYSAFDNWSVAISTYRRNIASHAFALDLSDVESATEQILNLEPDIIAGGPPCQDFSTAGKRSEGKQANLTVAFGEIVARCSPLCFLMENVPQVRLSKTYHLNQAQARESGLSICGSGA